MNGIVSSKIYDKHHDFSFEIENFRFMMELRFLAPLPVVYIFHSLFILQEYVLMLMRNRCNQVQHLTQDTIWENDKNTQEIITYNTAKRLALSQQVTTRLQGTDKTV